MHKQYISQHCAIHLLSTFCAVIFLLSIVTSCNTAHENTTAPNPTAEQTQIYGPEILPRTPTPTLLPSALHGPTNFVFRLPLSFTDTKGVTKDNEGKITPIDISTIEKEVTANLEHFLFVVPNDTSMTIYRPGGGAPSEAQVTQKADGSTVIDYRQQTNSTSGSLTITFSGTITNDQIQATYQQRFFPVISSDAVASEVGVTFNTRLQWATADQIPTPPGKGTYQFTPSNAIQLSWQPGRNASTYAIYRIIPDQKQQFQLVDTIKDTSYTDTSGEAWKHAHSSTGIGYAIFSVGPTGIKNPNYSTITISTRKR